MACYLRAFGDGFDVDTFLAASTIEWSDVWRLGEAKRTGGAKPSEYRTSGLQIKIGEGDDFVYLLREASEFVRGNREELLRLAVDTSVEKLGVDFGLTWNPEAAMMSVTLPPEFIDLIRDLRFSVEISYYDLG